MLWYNLIQSGRANVNKLMNDLCIILNGNFAVFKCLLKVYSVLLLWIFSPKAFNCFGATHKLYSALSSYLVILSMTVLSLASVSAGNSFCTISLTN